MAVLKARVGSLWEAVGYGGGVTPGGVLGDLLIKNSATNGDARWGVDPPRLITTSAAGVSTALSALPSLQVAEALGLHLVLDGRTVQALAAESGGIYPASTLYLNRIGGIVDLSATLGHVTIGSSVPAGTPYGLAIPAPATGTIKRASVRIGDWAFHQDVSANGTKDFVLYENTLGNYLHFNTAGNTITFRGGPQLITDGAYLQLKAASGLGNLYYDIGGSGSNNWRRTSDFAALMTLSNAGRLTVAENLVVNGNQMSFPQGGGWYMVDTTWIRAVGNKSIYTIGSICAEAFMGVGITSSAHKLHVVGSAYVSTTLEAQTGMTVWAGLNICNYNAGSGASTWGSMQFRAVSGVAHPNGVAGITCNVAQSSIAAIMRVYGNTGEGWHMRNNPDTAYIGINASAFAVGSSVRTKQNVEPVDDKVLLDLARQVRPVRFEFSVRPQNYLEIEGKPEAEWPGIDHDCATHVCDGTPDNPCAVALNDHPRFGFLAEDMAQVVPEAVELDGDRLPSGIDVAQTASLAFAGVGALLRRIEELERTIEQLQGASL
jgi:hypothetical protein